MATRSRLPALRWTVSGWWKRSPSYPTRCVWLSCSATSTTCRIATSPRSSASARRRQRSACTGRGAACGSACSRGGGSRRAPACSMTPLARRSGHPSRLRPECAMHSGTARWTGSPVPGGAALGALGMKPIAVRGLAGAADAVVTTGRTWVSHALPRRRPTPVTCAEVASELPRILDDGVPAEARLVSHVETCLRCQAELARYRRMVRLAAPAGGCRGGAAPGVVADILSVVGSSRPAAAWSDPCSRPQSRLRRSRGGSRRGRCRIWWRSHGLMPAMWYRLELVLS